MIGTFVLYVVMLVSVGPSRPIAISQEHESYNSCQVALEEFKKSKQQIIVGVCVRK